LLAVTWLVFIYAIISGQLVEASLGYFACPLLTVLLGVILLRERLRWRQSASIAIALLGLAALTVMVGRLPWIAVTLAFSYALYALVRKIVGMDALVSLAVETLLLAPLALAYLACVAPASNGIGGGWSTLGLLMLAGPVTTVPLLFFGAAARRLSLSTLGMLQYLSTTLQFLVATVFFHEPFHGVQIVSFGCVWTAIALYTADSLHASRQSPIAMVEPVVADL
jgi:chloramphenicol-sensitive protein RarD